MSDPISEEHPTDEQLGIAKKYPDGVKCSECGQDTFHSGEYPCQQCGRPKTWDPEQPKPPKPKLRFKVPQSTEFKKLVELIVVLADEPAWIATKDGVTLQYMDQSRVAMMRINMPRESFEEYDLQNVDLNEQLRFTLQLDRVKSNVLKNVYRDETLEFTAPVDNGKHREGYCAFVLQHILAIIGMNLTV